jgi:hypothetical protein
MLRPQLHCLGIDMRLQRIIGLGKRRERETRNLSGRISGLGQRLSFVLRENRARTQSCTGRNSGDQEITFEAAFVSARLILVLLALKMVTNFLGILPLTRLYAFNGREGMHTTLLMSTGLTFGTISALFGLTNRIIDQQQYTVLVTAVIGLAVIPTLVAQRWFMPSGLLAAGADPEAEKADV